MKRLIFLLALITGAIPLHAQSVVPGSETGRIVFISDRDGNPELYLMAADGSGLTRLTYTPRADTDAAWSPDGSSLVFTTETAAGGELVVLDAASGAAKQITSLGATISHPVWSPDGTQIAFAANPAGYFDIYTIAPDGTDLANRTSSPANDTWPTWSPEGAMIAFQSDRDGDPELYRLDLDSATTTRLTESPGVDRNPIWSPGYNRIAFISERYGNADIFVIDFEGDNLIQLSDTQFDDSSPVWSPGGTMLAYIGSTQARTTELYTINADGSDLRQRTTDGMKAASPSWSPDGEWIAYASNRGGGFDIYALHAGGEGWIALTDLPASSETRPLWARNPVALLPTLTPTPTLAATFTPTPAPEPDLMLVYDLSLPSFELVNISQRNLNLSGLRFEGNGRTVDSSVWEQSNPSLILEAFPNNACLGLWGIAVQEPPLSAECVTRLAWWASDNTVFWTGGTFTVSYYDVPVVVCESNTGRCPVNLSAGTSGGTESPPEITPTQVTGNGDVLLTYDPTVPSFYLTNVSEKLLNLAPVSFTGNGVLVNAGIWLEAGMSSDLSHFDQGGCLGLWGLSVEQAPAPVECRFRHAWWASDEIVFWTGDTFSVVYAGNPLAICDVSAGSCRFNMPEG